MRDHVKGIPFRGLPETRLKVYYFGAFHIKESDERIKCLEAPIERTAVGNSDWRVLLQQPLCERFSLLNAIAG
jgi:hypothetical protein